MRREKELGDNKTRVGKLDKGIGEMEAGCHLEKFHCLLCVGHKSFKFFDFLIFFLIEDILFSLANRRVQ